MRVRTFLIAAALLGGLSAPAVAQTAAPSPTPANTAASITGTVESHWIAAGFVGSNFGLSTDDPSIDFGGQLGYLWRGIVGPECLADFAPTFKMDNVFLADSPTVNSYMANVIGAVPLGAEGQIQPYLSGGFGGIQLKSNLFNEFATVNPLDSPVVIAATGTTTGNQMKFGGNVGVGLTGFGGSIGFRGDVRYYRAADDDNPSASTPADQFTQTLLSGLSFWRANVGLAFRW